MDEFTDKQIRRIADNLQRIADTLEKMFSGTGIIAVDNNAADSVDPPPPPVRTS
jgi:hypothetical protein